MLEVLAFVATEAAAPMLRLWRSYQPDVEGRPLQDVRAAALRFRS
jgi:hypothetical protein